MRERQRQEVLDDLIQVTLFDAVLTGRGKNGLFKRKSMEFVGE